MTVQPHKMDEVKGNNIDLMNAVRENASAQYRASIPVLASGATQAERLQVASLIDGNPQFRNEFYEVLANRIAFVFGTSRSYYNKYRGLKKGDLELGEIAEEVFVEACKPQQFNPNIAESEVFKQVKADVHSALHIVNFKWFYKTTISRQRFSSAFLTERGLVSFIEQIIGSAVNGAEVDEQNIIKWLIGRAILDGRIKTVKIPAGDTQSDSYAVAKVMKKTVDDMTFPTTQFNEAGVLNWSDYPFIKFFISNEFGARYSIDVLSASFQLDYTNFMGQLLKYDSLSNVDFDRLRECTDIIDIKDYTEDEKEALNKVLGLSFDEYLIQWYGRLREWGDINNPQGLYWNQTLHLWEMVSLSPFAPAVAYVTEIGVVEEITVSPTEATLTEGASLQLIVVVSGTGIYSKEVTYESSDSENVTVTESGLVYVKGTPAGDVTITVKSKTTPAVTGTCTIKNPQ